MNKAPFSIKWYSRIVGFIILVSLVAGEFQATNAQWRIIAPKLAVIPKYGAAMTYCDGIIWMAADNIYKSTDSGMTWTAQPLPNADGPYDIQFDNSSDGIYAGPDTTFLTSDGGTTWNAFASPSFSACFLNNVHSIAISGGVDNSGKVTPDGGTNWNYMPGQEYTLCVRYKAGTIYEFGGSTSGGYVFSSSDLGATWQQGKTGIDVDSYSFAVDSCDVNRIYLSHEDYIIPTDQFSKIYVTTDRGDTWQVAAYHPEPFFCGSVAEGNSTVYCQSIVQGVFRSTDRGMTWSSIGGPSVTYDTRLITAINDNLLIAVDSNGNVWRTDNSGGDSVIAPQSSSANNMLFLPSQSSILNQSLCNTPVDTSILLGIIGCGTLAGTLDSLWLTGSSAFQIADLRADPRTLGIVDSILVSYSGTQGTDTSMLHLQYNLGTGVNDTTIQLIGSAAFTAQTAQLHREAASAYYGQIDSLTLGVDLSLQINIDSLWPYITDIQFTFAWDSSVVSEDDYIPPSGWSLKSLSSNGNSENVEIQNKSSSPTQPLNLGTALFLPISTQLATGWVQLPSLVIDIGSQQLFLCVANNEDNHWSVKTLGVLSGVVETQPVKQNSISIYPNPASDELQIMGTQSGEVHLFDLLGRERMNATTNGNDATLDVSHLEAGMYFLRMGNESAKVEVAH